MDTNVKRREWVKTAAIIFLAVLLVLTFFSNTIMNRTLPEVATAGVTDGSIVAKVRGTGTVKANGSHNVKTTQTREIRSVMVKVGQEVKTGDTLFVLGAGDSQELETAKETLRDLQYAYQKSAVSMPNFNYTTENRALKTAYDAMEAALKTYTDAENLYNEMLAKYGDEDITNQLTDAQNKMQQAYADLISVQASYDQEYQRLSAEVVAWQQRVNELTVIPEPSTDPTTPPTTIPTTTPGQDGKTEDAGNQKGQTDGASLLSAGSSSTGYIRLGAVQAYGAVNPDEVTDLATAKAWLASAQAALADFVSSNKTTLENAQSVYDAAKNKYDAIVKYNEEINYKLVPYREARDKASADYTAAENAYYDAMDALAYKQSQDDKTLASASIDLQQQAEKIKAAQEKVKQLSGDAGDQITANVNGVVTAINVSAGDTVTKDTVVCTIEVPDMGHTLSFSVTNDQAQRLRVGDTATVSNYYWGNEIVATLSNIRTDPKNPQTNKELTFELSGDVTSGSELTISVGQKSANYDTIVPNSAIRSDNNGKFVLAIEAKSSPLGNRYIAKRVSVEVLASDDNNSAVVADLSYGDYVITTSNSPVKSGDQVRMAENNA